jgi:hypothetical protein
MSNHPTVTLPGSGMTVRIRRQPGDMLRLIEASARRECEPRRPQPPTQRLEVGPGEYKEIEDVNNEEYVASVEAFETEVQELFSKKMLDVIVKVGLVDNPDIAELSTLRSLYSDMNIEIPEDDRTFWVQFMVAPSAEDFAHLTFEIFGRSLPTEAQVAFHRTLFQRNVETPTS